MSVCLPVDLFVSVCRSVGPHPHVSKHTTFILIIFRFSVVYTRSPQELKGDAEMVAEVEVFLHVDDVVAVVSVFPPDGIQDLQLNQSLMVKPASQITMSNIPLVHLNHEIQINHIKYNITGNRGQIQFVLKHIYPWLYSINGYNPTMHPFLSAS